MENYDIIQENKKKKRKKVKVKVKVKLVTKKKMFLIG